MPEAPGFKMSLFYPFAVRAVAILALGLAMLPVAVRAGDAAIPEDIEISLAAPPGRLVDVGGYRLHIHCRGHGSPVVVFDAGLGGFSIDWIYVQVLLDREATVCAYDRAGYGWSDPGPAPRDSDHIVEELALLLERAGIASPYILVGHSFGGLNVQNFAKTFPRSVAGLVLVDASHPDQWERLPDLPARSNRPGPRPGTLVTLFDPNVVSRHYPERYWHPIRTLMASAKALAAQRHEFMNFSVSASQVSMAGVLPHVPLVVVTRGLRTWPHHPLGDALEQAWADLQRDLTASVAGGRQVIAAHSGHLIPLDEPEVVAEAVRSILREHCGRHLAGTTAGPAVLSC
jgi:pimeloyl-ACP methyl ester carboxylesterase